MTLRRERTRCSAVVLGLVAFGLWAQRSLLFHLGDHVYAQNLPGNDALLHVWTLAWGQHALRAQPWAPFDANIFFPYADTLLYSDHLLGLAFLLAPLRLFTDDVVLVHNLAVVAAPILNALAMAWLVYDTTTDRAAAALAGVAYGFAPLRFHTDLHQIQMLAAWWLPVALLAARRAIIRGAWRWALLAGAALLLQGLSGIYLTAFFLPFLLLAHLVWLRAHPFASHRLGWTRLVAAEALALLLLVPSALSYQRVQATLGSSRSPVLNALLVLLPSRLLDYLPLVALLPLCIAALVARDESPSARRTVRFYLAMAAVALVLSFGPSISLPGSLGAVRGPYSFVMGLPGFDALRAPGRMVHVALLGIAAAGAIGLATLRRRLPTRAAMAVTVAAIAITAWECRTPTFPLQPVAAVDPVYAWMAGTDEVRAYAAMPFGQTALAEQRFQLASTASWTPLLNGSMGIEPPLHGYFARRMRRFPEAGTLDELATVGTTHVAVHWAGITPEARAAIDAATAGPAPTLRERTRSAAAAVYALAVPAPALPPALAPALPRAGWTVTASENAYDAGLAIDDAPGTRWASWGAHERELHAWWAPEPFIDRWWAFIRRQPSRLAVDLGAAHRVQAVSLGLAGSDPAVLPLLELSTSADGTHWTPAAAELTARPDARALVTDPARQHYAFVLEPPVDARHVQLAVHGLDWRVEDLRIHAAD